MTASKIAKSTTGCLRASENDSIFTCLIEADRMFGSILNYLMLTEPQLKFFLVMLEKAAAFLIV
jgi:hypothetical protein